MQFQSSSLCSVDGNDSDSQLIASALSGEQRAYTKLVDRYQGRLTSAIQNKVACSGLVDDIVQDAFVRAFKNLHSFRSESGFYTWLYRIALNSRRHYLQNRHRLSSLDEIHEACQPVGRSSCLEASQRPLTCLERTEDCRAVSLAMQRLDTQHREILRLREFEGFDYRRIADVLHLTMGTVRSRISRARAQLRKELVTYWSAKPVDLGCRFVANANGNQRCLGTA
jgi:RNA polymerase sigma-70 factor (ECF subfamily)